jgi:hypothetical protein
LLSPYSLSLRVGKRERICGIKNLISFYELKHLNYIDEIIYYKMQRQEKIKDINKIVKIDTSKFIFNELIDIFDDKIKTSNENKKADDIFDDKLIEYLNTFELDITE